MSDSDTPRCERCSGKHHCAQPCRVPSAPPSQSEGQDGPPALQGGAPEKLPCPGCGGLQWYRVGNLLRCFKCAKAFIVSPALVESIEGPQKQND